MRHGWLPLSKHPLSLHLLKVVQGSTCTPHEALARVWVSHGNYFKKVGPEVSLI